MEQLENIIEEATAQPLNEVKLLAALNAAGIQNVDQNSLGAYAEALEEANTAGELSSLADVQKVIDKVNKDAGNADQEAAVVKAVADATNQIQLLAALQANFERVNSDWITSYATANVTVADDTQVGLLALGENNYFGKDAGADKDGIQAAIDTANATAIDTVAASVDTAAKQAAVTALIEKWIKADDPKTPNNTPKADAIKASKVKEAAFKVAEATTQNSVYNALVAYANATPDTVLKASELNANLKVEYLAALKEKTKATLVTEIQAGNENIKSDIVVVADDAALEAAMTAITAKYADVVAEPTNATALTAFKASLQKLADVTSHQPGTAKFDFSIVKDANLAAYATAFNTDTKITADSTVEDVVAKITPANDSQGLTAALNTINDAKSSASQVRDALLEIAVANGTIQEAKDFINLVPQARLEVAELVIKDRADQTDGKYANLDDILAADGSGAIKDQVEAHAAEVAKFNAIGNLADATVTDIKDALDTYGYDAYKALSTVDKLAVAEEISKLAHEDKDGVKTPYNFEGADKVKTLKAANDIIDAAIAAIK